MTTTKSYLVRPIGFIRSKLKRRGDAPRQDRWARLMPGWKSARVLLKDCKASLRASKS